MAEEHVKQKRGFLTNNLNYKDWFMSHDGEWIKEHLVTCTKCGCKFIPDAPNQKYCSDKCFRATHESCFYDGTWVNKMDKRYLIPIAER